MLEIMQCSFRREELFFKNIIIVILAKPIFAGKCTAAKEDARPIWENGFFSRLITACSHLLNVLTMYH